MPVPEVLILSSGGVRSLVASAMACAEAGALKVTLLHVADGRGHAAARLDSVRRQAKYLGVARVIEADMASPKARVARRREGSAEGLILPRILMTAAGAAITHAAGRIIWPAQANGDADLAARCLEQAELVRHLGQLEFADLPAFEIPLLELTDAQLIELGSHMQLPWELAWTCLLPGSQACRLCPACRRRRAAFDALGLIDPGDPATVAA
jgi:7-cyano-7-deazaguanine synthase in queuosine biosynthesis